MKAYREKNKPRFKKLHRVYYEKNKDELYWKGRTKARLRHAKTKKKKSSGFLYFFKGIAPGFYKVGCTTNWKNRRRNYWGPSGIERVFFVRPVTDLYYAETMLKIFLVSAGYEEFHMTAQGDWFVLDHERVF